MTAFPSSFPPASKALRCAWLLCGLLTCYTYACPAEESRSLSVPCAFAAPQVETQDSAVRISIPGCGNVQSGGNLSLPFRTVKVLLPPGFRVSAVAAQGSQPPAVLPVPAASLTTIRRPPSQAQLRAVHRMSGFDIALVRLFPVQYKPDSRQLQFYSRLELTLSLVPDGTGAQPTPARCWSSTLERVSSWVDNPSLLAELTQTRPSAETDAPIFDYLILTGNDLALSFQPLVDLRTKEGHRVKVETVDPIASSQPGRDLPEKIRNYIRYAHTNWGVQSVLLGGDIGVIPARYAYVPRRLPERECLVPCDLYYACLDGSWNRDGNSRWGETTDGESVGDVDLLPEVDLGRAPVETAEEVAAYVSKLARYSQQAQQRARRALLLGAFLEQGDAQGGAMLDLLRPALDRFVLRMLDDRPSRTAQWHAPDVLRELNADPLLVVYCGHAEAGSVMRLVRSDLSALTNQLPFLFSSAGCDAGQFDNDQFTPDCIGEEIVKLANHGAVAAVLNSRLGWYDAREEWKYSGEFQARLVERLMRSHEQIGRACQLARADLLGQVEVSGLMPYRICFLGLTLLGDPLIRPVNHSQ